MLFGLHFMSHFTLYNAVHNTHAILTMFYGWCDCWRNAISIRIRVKLSPHRNDCLNCSLYEL